MNIHLRSVLVGVVAPVVLLMGCASASKPASAEGGGGGGWNGGGAAAQAAEVPRVAEAKAREPFRAKTVQALLEEMTAAVNAGDQERYLACVLKKDPVFAQEQVAWAKDLGRKRPESFEVKLADPEARVSAPVDGCGDADVTFTWKMPGAAERTLTFNAVFKPTGWGWLYAGESWKVMEAPGVRVMYVEGAEDAAKVVADVLPEVRKHVHEVFGLEGDEAFNARVQEVKLYRSMKHLQHSIYLSYSDGLGGWNEPGESIKVLVNRRGTTKQGMRVLLGHEYGHCATFQYGPHANDMQWWILEGVAELSAELYSKDGMRMDRAVRGWSETERLVEWDRLADFHGEATQHMAQVYTQGHHMVKYITTRFGDAKRIAWMRAMSVEKPATIDEATRKVLGMSFEQLDKEWRKSLEAPEPAKEPAGAGKE